MLSLADYLKREGLGKSEFARRLGERLDRTIPPQSIHRWTLPIGDKDYSVPRSKIVRAIELETAGAVTPASWYANGVKPRRKPRAVAISVAAARKAAASRRQQARA